MRRFLFLSSVLLALSGCGINQAVTASKKYSRQETEKDYSLYRNILEAHHPSLYWYTTKDSIDEYFEKGRRSLRDSMTEPEFRKVLSYVTSKINCGHTSVRPSKAWVKYTDTARLSKMFPLSMKVWDGGLVVTQNLHRRDSILKRGTIIRSINGHGASELVDTMFEYISTDGYNRTHKYQTLSNRGYFGSLYSSLFGLENNYLVEYEDVDGKIKNINIPVYNPVADTGARTGTRTFRPITPQPSKKERRQMQLNNVRLLRIDSVNHSAMMDLASFGRGYNLRKFFRRSFRVIEKNKISHLIIDVRSNGGGSVTNSTAITRFLSQEPFKIADSLYAIRKSSKYDKYIQNHFWNKLFITFFTRQKRDDNYHFTYFERRYFKPRTKNHFDGKVYILTGGNSFSATTLFASALVKQENVTIVGEETGGGAYGNSAWLIPDVTLPETGVRFRLPLFRLVIDKTIPKDGKGLQPEVSSVPTVDAIRRNADFKAEKAMELINADKKKKGTEAP